MQFQPDSPQPLYIQIKDILQSEINKGIYAVDSRLPSERDLALRYSVSRMTVRQALQLLMQQGMIYSRVGKGTFVRHPKIDQALHELTSFTEDMHERKAEPTSCVLYAGVGRVPLSVALHLQVTPNTEVVMLSRIRLSDGLPLALEHAYLEHARCEGILDEHDFSRESLYCVLREQYGWALIWADQTIEARLPDEKECELLHIQDGMPVLSTQRITRNQLDEPVEFVSGVYRSDHFQLRVTLRHPGSDD